MTRPALGILLLATLAGCQGEAESTTRAGADFKVDRLFQVDGCTVYRFHDGGPPPALHKLCRPHSVGRELRQELLATERRNRQQLPGRRRAPALPARTATRTYTRTGARALA